MLHTAIRLLGWDLQGWYGWDSGQPGLGVAASLQQGLEGTLKTTQSQRKPFCDSLFARALTLSYQSQVRLAFL